MHLDDAFLAAAFRALRDAFPTTACDGAAEQALTTWLRHLVTWNRKLDLTAARTREELVDLMLADAFAIAPHLAAPAAAVVDVGSGAGAPGLPLALLRGDVSMTLIEPLAKRTSFLRTALAAAGRADVTVVRGKGAEHPAYEAPSGRFQVAVSRATLAPGEWLPLGAALTEPGGTVWVLTARDTPPDGGARCEQLAQYTYVWPLTGAARTATVYRSAV